jgi:hypothetical protein
MIAMIAMIAIVTLASGPARAGDDPEDAARVLARHRYVPSSLVVWGFVEDRFAATSSFGIADYQLEVGKHLGLMREPRKSRFIAIAQTFGGGLALTPWLGLSARATASGIISRDGVAALVVGAQAAFGAEAGVSLRLLRAGPLQVTARGDVGWNQNRSTVPARLPDSPYVEGDITTLRPSLVVAVPLAPWLGLQASGSFEWRRFDVAERDRVRTIRGALAASVALAPIPLTLLLGGEASHDYGRDSDTVTSRVLLGSETTQVRTEAGLFYQGRHDLDLGAVFAFELDADDTDRRILGHLRMGYYF